MLLRLEEMDHAVARIHPPPAYSENRYGFWQHLELVRALIQERTRRPNRAQPGWVQLADPRSYNRAQ